MLYVLGYFHSQIVFDLDFLKEKNNDFIFISPKPILADIYREQLSHKFPQKQYDVITISQFLKEEFRFFLSREDKIKRKSELLLLFSSLWKKCFPDYSYEYFSRSFKFLTELRSFTLDSALYESILDEYDDVLKNSVMMFNQLMEAMGEDDEHSAYAKLTSQIRQCSLDDYHEKKRNIIFMGFQFMTGQQVDFIKSLAIRDDVYIPLPYIVLKNGKNSDWFNWLRDSQDSIETLGTKTKLPELKLNEFSSASLSTFLKSLKQQKNIIIPTMETTFEEIAEVPYSNHFFKSSVDIYEEAIVSFRNSCEFKVFGKSNISIDKFREFLIQSVNELKCKDSFIQTRVILSLLQIINEWSELSSDNSNINERDMRVFFEVLSLNLPRNFAIPLMKSSELAISNLERVVTRDVAICVTSKNTKLKSSASSYPENVERLLIAIGPIKRAELELDFFKQKVHEVLSTGNAEVYIEKSILKESDDWNQVLSDFDIRIEDEVSLKNKRALIDPWLKNDKETYKVNKISATRLQTFIDCKRKYFFQYIEKILPDMSLTTQLLPNQLGELEHRVVELYCINASDYDEKKHEKVVLSTMTEFCVENELVVNPLYFEEYFIEIFHYTQNAIKFINFLNSLNRFNFQFEKKIESNERRGSIDAFSLHANLLTIIDFKRSGSSIPAKTNIFEFKKIQIPFYLSYQFEQAIKNDILIGYFNMAEPDASLFLTTDEYLIAEIKKYFNWGIRSKKIDLFEDKEAFLKNYLAFEKNLIEEINNEKIFPALPREISVCTYCGLSNTCPKGEV